MNNFFKSILTIWVVALLIVLGIMIGLKGIIIDTTDIIIKQELSHTLVQAIEENTKETIPEESVKKIENTIQENKEIRKIMDNYYDKIIDILSDEQSEINIDAKEELNSIIDDGEEILKEYGITIDEKEKQELLENVSTEEINNLINESVAEVRNNTNDSSKIMIRTIGFIMSTKFKIMLVSLIAIATILIALLYKNYYSWLSNFGYATLIAGIMMSFLIPSGITWLINNLTMEESTKITISTQSFRIYGYYLLGIAVVSIVINTILTKTMQKKEEQSVSIEKTS